MTDAASMAFGEIRGFLAAFAAINGKADHNYTFTFDLLPQAENAARAAQKLFAVDDAVVQLTIAEDWMSALRPVIQRWLFEFLDERRGQLLQPGRFFWMSFEDGREWAVNWLMERFKLLGPVIQVSTVAPFNSRFCDCLEDDFVLEATGKAYYLHLGVSD